MPVLSRWMIRLAMFNLWIGAGLATVLISRKGLPGSLSPAIWQWLPAHVDLLLIGWMVQLAMGTGYWIMPRLAFTNYKRGRLGFARGAAVLLNAGVWLYVGAILVSSWQGSGNHQFFLVLQTLGLTFQFAGILSFSIHVWPRIHPPAIRNRPQKGQKKSEKSSA